MGEIADALRRAHTREAENPRLRDRLIPEDEEVLVPRPPPPPPTEAIEEPLTAPLPGETGFQALESSSPRNSTPQQPQPLVGAERTGRPERICLEDARGAFAQQYHRLGIRLRNMTESMGARSIVVTSSNPSDGKTTTACNLAVALAMTDHDCRVVLVDLDLHRANVAKSLSLRVDTPVEAVLRGDNPIEDAVIQTDIDGLCVVGADSSFKEPAQLLAGRPLAAMIRKLSNRFDWVIIDTPPMLVTSDAQIILQQADKALLVARAGFSSVRGLKESMEHLPKDKVLASFLNSSRSLSKIGYYDYYSDAQIEEGGEEGDSENADASSTPSPHATEALNADRA